MAQNQNNSFSARKVKDTNNQANLTSYRTQNSPSLSTNRKNFCTYDHSEISSLRTQIGLQKKQVKDLDECLKNSELTKRNVEQKMESFQQEAQFFKTQFEKKQKDSQSLLVKVEYLINEKQKLEKENQQQKDYINKLEVKFTNLVHQKGNQAANAAQMLLEHKLQQLEEQNYQLKQNIKTQSNDIQQQNTLRIQVDSQSEGQVVDQIKLLQQELEKAYTCIEEFKLIRSSDSEELTKQEIKVQALQGQNADLCQKIQNLKEDNSHLQVQLDRLSMNFQEISEEYTKLTNNMQKSQVNLINTENDNFMSSVTAAECPTKDFDSNNKSDRQLHQPQQVLSHTKVNQFSSIKSNKQLLSQNSARETENQPFSDQINVNKGNQQEDKQQAGGVSQKQLTQLKNKVNILENLLNEEQGKVAELMTFQEERENFNAKYKQLNTLYNQQQTELQQYILRFQNLEQQYKQALNEINDKQKKRQNDLKDLNYQGNIEQLKEQLIDLQEEKKLIQLALDEAINKCSAYVMIEKELKEELDKKEQQIENIINSRNLMQKTLADQLYSLRQKNKELQAQIDAQRSENHLILAENDGLKDIVKKCEKKQIIANKR